MASAARPAGLPAWSGRYAARKTTECLATWGHLCHLCRRARATTADHVLPRSQGGSDDLANLRPACRPCNTARGTTPLAEWFAAHPVPRREQLIRSSRWR